MYVEPCGKGYRIGYREFGTGRFMVLTLEQVKQLKQLLNETEL